MTVDWTPGTHLAALLERIRRGGRYESPDADILALCTPGLDEGLLAVLHALAEHWTSGVWIGDFELYLKPRRAKSYEGSGILIGQAGDGAWYTVASNGRVALTGSSGEGVCRRWRNLEEMLWDLSENDDV